MNLVKDRTEANEAAVRLATWVKAELDRGVAPAPLALAMVGIAGDLAASTLGLGAALEALRACGEILAAVHQEPLPQTH